MGVHGKIRLVDRANSVPHAWIALCAGLAIGVVPAVNAAPVSWVSPLSGQWTMPGNWSSSPGLPGPSDDVTIDQPGSLLIDLVGSAQSINSLLTRERVTLSGGASLSVGTTAQVFSLFTLNNGSLFGGQWSFANNTFSVSTSANNRVSGVTMSGNANIGTGSARLSFDNGWTVNGALTFAGAGAQITSTTTQTLGGTGSLAFTGVGPVSQLRMNGGTTLTISSGFTIRGASLEIGTLAAGAGVREILNQGTIRADGDGSGVLVSGSAMTNTGTLEAINGGLLSLRGAWSSAGGTLRVNNGTLDLGGSFTTAGLNLAAFSRTGGTVRHTGSLNNVGEVLTLNSAVGSWRVEGGSITGGSVIIDAGQSLVFNQSNNNRLMNTSVNGALDLSEGSARVYVSDSVLSGTAILGQGSFIHSETDHTWNGLDVAMVGSGGAERRLGMSGGTTLTLGADSSVTASGGAIGAVGFGLTGGIGSGTLVNHGLISADGPGTSLSIPAGVFTNTGTIEAKNGGLTVVGISQSQFSSQWSSTGILRVDGGTLAFGGQYSSAVLDGLQRTGGLINLLPGVMDNTGRTLSLDATTGSLNMNGGRIRGGTLNLSAAGTLTFVPPSFTISDWGTFEQLTINGELSVPTHNARLAVAGGLTLNGTVTLSGDSSSIGFSTSQTLTGGTYVLQGSTSLNLAPGLGTNSNAELTLSPTTTVRGIGFIGQGGGGQLGYSSGSVVNHGTILADLAGGELRVAGLDVLNTGTMRALPGGVLTVNGGNGFTNNGRLVVDGGRINLGESSSTNIFTGPMGTLEMNSGHVQLGGTLHNQGRTLSIGTSATFGMGATSRIIGGTIDIAPGAAISFGTGGGGGPYLEGVAIRGNITLQGDQGQLALYGDNSLDGMITVRGRGFRVPGGGQTSINGGTIRFDGSVSGDRYIEVGPSATLTFGPSTLIRGARGWVGTTAGAIDNLVVNQGIISADEPGLLTIGPGIFSNTGLLEARNGSTLIIDSFTNWSNTGVIRPQAGSEVWLGGRYTTAGIGTVDASLGTVRLQGTLNNTGATLEIDQNRSAWLFGPMVLRGGTVNVAPSELMRVRAGNVQLDNVLVNGVIELGEPGASVNLTNGARVNGSVRSTAPATALNFIGDQVIDAGTFEFDGIGSGGYQRIGPFGFQTSANLVLGEDVLVRGGNLQVYTSNYSFAPPSIITNYGRISADIPGSTISIRTDNFTNFGTIEAVNGGLIEFLPPKSLVSGGERGVLPITNQSIIAIESGSGIELDGSFAQTASGTLTFELGQSSVSTASAIFSVTGPASLDGGLSLTLDSGLVPQWGQQFNLFSAASVIGDFDMIELPMLAEPTLRWWAEVTETDVRAGIRHYADLDHDGLVGLSDIAAITTSWGLTGTGLLGDIDLDGLVGLSDIAVVTSNWGLSAPALVAIPAPAGVLAFVFAGSFAARRRRE